MVSAGNNSTLDNTITLAELRCIAKDRGINGYSSMKKEQLLEVLNNGE